MSGHLESLPKIIKPEETSIDIISENELKDMED
jgi:hypothetical protein